MPNALDPTSDTLDLSGLTQALQEAGVGLEAEALDRLLAGIAASPVADAPTAWMSLFGTNLDADLQAWVARAVRAQSVDGGLSAGSPASAARISALRAELDRRGLAGFVVPRADAHQLEAPPPHAQRLTWLTGFTGSAGVAVVLKDVAAIFVDGRYTLQVANEVDASLVEPRHLSDAPPADFIAEYLDGGVLGYDPWLHTAEGVQRLQQAVERAGGSLAPVEDNPLDAVWPDQPPAPLTPAHIHDLAYAGEPSTEKRARVATTLADAGQAAAVLNLPDSICWLLNVRGRDVLHTPLVLSFAVLNADGRLDWYVDPRKVPSDVCAGLDDTVQLHAPELFLEALDRLAQAGKPVRVDAATAPAAIVQRIEAAGGRVARDADPCQLPKARKNATELAGARNAHVRDGAAVTRFLCWLQSRAPERADRGEPITEIEAAEALAAFRRADPLFRDHAFDTISGAGEHGAIVHYRVDDSSNRALQTGELYLVDSGGQYLDGTTDITRTLPVGTPTGEQRARYTLVLKGHIALSLARFPDGTTGSQIDALARRPLWSAGLDYDHGTGHGVGSYLGVHEGPQRISKHPSSIKLAPGMICSNEPGYYKTGAYGIRIENLVAVTAHEGSGPDSRSMLGFETLTLAPYCRALIDPALLTADELAWIDSYHSRVRDTLTPHLDADTARWLAGETAPLGR
ncbi:aminopeptidase P family protein [Rhodovibrio salinarum]|uniref:Aminopeptidase P family protein n=1 Tax=Rhodovibrio salinarum TaxID=1087 RepID=A0A934QFR2_9PROT|nr:aminopeptidase P family protein [Rhodovibrio salinarum]MBK1695807.1 aminopeptidase P family protein [Rhodovibrio salinarum]